MAADPLRGTVRRTVLPGGLRVLTEAVPAMRSVSFGIWIGIGSRDERPGQAGVSHFLEHLLFKGTQHRDALAIASGIESVGGETNAFTAREYTCYYARFLDEDLPLAANIICDLVTASVLAEEDVETERGVILEEIAMHDDEPGENVHDLLARSMYGDHPLGRPISGSVATVSAVTRRQLMGFYRRRYAAPAMVVTAAGNIDHARVVRLVRNAFRRAGNVAGRLDTGGEPLPVRSLGRPVAMRTGTVSVEVKDTEQAHLTVGRPAFNRRDERRFALGVLNNIVGGGMSSRLFQEVRERRGLAYSVYSYTTQYADSGLFAVYAGCAPGKADEVLAIVRDQLADVAARGLTGPEVTRGKGMLKGSLVLGLEDTGSRMTRLAKGELLHGELLPVDELLTRVDAVTVADVRSVASDLLAGPMSLAVIGPFEDHDFAAAVTG